ncbi:MAG: alpha/beta hydrolase [Hamadaea sp.]|nr:alpha/beta hydrolase [Hamadaea sp.]NUR49588.1 alpha/beta hydrolase [Hamadaea sp.]NUT06435.1 alpha/beta hydrolase [Hamadaea sp.]
MNTLADAEGRVAVACGVTPVEYLVEIPGFGGRTRVLESGSGPAVLLLHDLGTAASVWLPLMARLDGHRVLAVDLPGFGQAEPTDYRTVSYLRGFAVGFVHGVVSALGLDAVALAGNGVGGLWALWTAADRAECVRAIALLGAPACTAGTPVLTQRKLTGRPLIGRRSGVSRDLWTRLGHAADRLPDGWAELTEAVSAQPEYETAFGTLSRATSGSGGFGATDLGRLAQPICLLLGERDPLARLETLGTIADVISGPAIYAGAAGHLPWLDNEQGTADVLGAFLAETDSAPASGRADRAAKAWPVPAPRSASTAPVADPGASAPR